MIGPLADSKADTEGSWMVFGHVPAAVTVLEGLKAKLPGARIDYAPGPEIRRDVPSFFETLIPGPKNAAADARRGRGGVPEGGRDGARRGPRDRGHGRAGRHERRGRLARAARPAGPAGGAAEGRGRPGQARRPRPAERPAPQHQLGGAERARDPRGVAAGDGGRPRGGGRPLRRREPRGQAAGHLPPQRRPQPPVLRPQPHPLARGRADVQRALLGRRSHAPLPLRLRPQLHHVRLRQPEGRRRRR